MKTSTLVIIIILLSLLLIDGIILLPKDVRNKTIRLIMLPIMWVIAIITFPFWYISSIFRKPRPNVEVVPVKFKELEDGKVEIILPNGQKKIISKEELLNGKVEKR